MVTVLNTSERRASVTVNLSDRAHSFVNIDTSSFKTFEQIKRSCNKSFNLKFLKVRLAHLHNSFRAGNFQHLAASLGAIRQRQVNDLSVPGKLCGGSTGDISGRNVT